MKELLHASFILRSATLALLLAARSCSADGPEQTPRIDRTLGHRFATVVDEAAELLDSAPCALVLGDFVDTKTGLPLTDTLAATGRSASDFVHSLRFTRGKNPSRFDSSPYAFTTPRSTVVYVCWFEFSRILSDRRLARAIIIHETLHTLGLGNDLPSSVKITRRILSRCGE